MIRPSVRLRTEAIVVFGLFLMSGAAFGDKTDIVEFGSSRMVGEVKRLDRGKLYFDTDSTGTIEIDWADVTRLVTKRQLRIEGRDSRVSFASFAEGADASHLAIESDDGIRSEPMDEIVAFEQIEDDFWGRLDISTSVGYSFARSNGVEQLNYSAKFSYDTEMRSRDLSFSSVQSQSSDEDSSIRRTLDYQTLRFSDSVYFTGWQASYEDNDALGLDYRVLAAAIAGREFYPLPNQRLRLYGGADVSEERFAGDSSQAGSELLLGGSIDWYKFRSPELDLSSSLRIFPSITSFGRVRANFDLSLRWEIYEDLFWNLTFYNDYDSDANEDVGIDESSSSNDYGITTSVGWSW